MDMLNHSHTKFQTAEKVVHSNYFVHFGVPRAFAFLVFGGHFPHPLFFLCSTVRLQ